MMIDAKVQNQECGPTLPSKKHSTWHISTDPEDVTRILSYFLASALDEEDSFYDFATTIITGWEMDCLWVETPCLLNGYCVAEQIDCRRQDRYLMRRPLEMMKVELFEIFIPRRQLGQGAKAYHCLESIWRSNGIDIVKLVAIPTARPFWTKMGFVNFDTIYAQQHCNQYCSYISSHLRLDKNLRLDNRHSRVCLSSTAVRKRKNMRNRLRNASVASAAQPPYDDKRSISMVNKILSILPFWTNDRSNRSWWVKAV
jgi:hypothetical protein